ncbi:methyl-accepting chemotaxis protein [Jannaschia sp. 2305UL9-9]|uniref:methyl-accepting chemotaxis protein n=1 Tax=Jannaschia sp. 2305UL9-9 TaxID=3121638 RepID=UPI0035288A50
MTLIVSPILERRRTQAARVLLVASAICAVPLAMIALAVGNDAIAVFVGSVAITACGAALSLAGPAFGRIGVALAVTGQSLVLTNAFSGHPSQMDSHLLIVASLILCSMLVDRQAIIAAVVVVVLNHASALLFAPALVFDSMDIRTNLERMGFHVAAVGLSAIAIVALVTERAKLSIAAVEDRESVEQAAREALEAETKANQAREQAEKEREAANEARREAEAAVTEGQAQAAARQALEAETASRQAAAYDEALAEQARQQSAISALRTVMAALSKGDLNTRLSQNLDTAYEDLRHDFNQAIDALQGAVIEIHTHTAVIRGESDDIATSSADLSLRTEAQAQTLEALAKSMDRLSRLINSAATDAKEAEAVVLATRGKAETGADVMHKAITAMGEIESSSAEVRKITTVIDDIAFQTNLLALNAGVEAARAGSAGRGFAVVASEVRALARRSSEAASRINTLIGQSGNQIRDGVTLVRDTGLALEEIIGSVSQASERMVQIATTSANQADGVAEISLALRDLDVVAQKNTAMFEETAAACQSLRGSSEGLSQALNQFLYDRSASRNDVTEHQGRAA